jgi:chemotaxis protein MotB
MSSDEKPVIIIRKKIISGHDDEGHGGAWKVAYADFMTAMMAFFLLLWLLSLSEDDKLQGIAEYFSSDEVALTSYGGKDVLSGEILQEIERKRPSERVEPNGAMSDTNGVLDEASNLAPEFKPGIENPWKDLTNPDEDSVVNAESVAAAIEEIKNLIEEGGELADLAKNIIIREVSGNVLIEIVESEETLLFETGKAALSEANLRILSEISLALINIPEDINITGHTDAAPFRSKNSYSNWELSSDRANATRRAMKELGLSDDRIGRVSGASDRELLNTSDPFALENRRVTFEISRVSMIKEEP